VRARACARASLCMRVCVPVYLRVRAAPHLAPVCGIRQGSSQRWVAPAVVRTRRCEA
jgi:hypothetical protein